MNSKPRISSRICFWDDCAQLNAQQCRLQEPMFADTEDLELQSQAAILRERAKRLLVLTKSWSSPASL